MAYIKQEHGHLICLECGSEMAYGRSDRKFCSDRCRDRHHYELTKKRKRFVQKVTNALSRNYQILEELLDSGVVSAPLGDLVSAGFNPAFVTSHHRVAKHDEYTCYDIRYVMTATRIFRISKIQNVYLTLQIGPKEDK